MLFRSGVVRVCHPSFLDFLNSEERAGSFWTDPATLNVKLFQQCLRLMNHNLRFNICQLNSAYVLNSEVRDLRERILANIPESLQYSCVHWMDHLLSAEAPLAQEASVRAAIREFLRSIKSLFWLEALSLTKELKAGINALGHCLRAYDVSVSPVYVMNGSNVIMIRMRNS